MFCTVEYFLAYKIEQSGPVWVCSVPEFESGDLYRFLKCHIAL